MELVFALGIRRTTSACHRSLAADPAAARVSSRRGTGARLSQRRTAGVTTSKFGGETSVFKKIFVTALAGSIVAVVAVAAAAALPIQNSSTVSAQAGEVAGLQCDTDGVSLNPRSNWEGGSVDAYVFAELSVSGIADACDGNVLKAVLTDLGGNYIVEGSTVIGADPAVITFTPAPETEDVHDIHLTIQGS
jgi:hypothetical protein